MREESGCWHPGCPRVSPESIKAGRGGPPTHLAGKGARPTKEVCPQVAQSKRRLVVALQDNVGPPKRHIFQSF